jgi:site-specific DNA recombinase
VSIDDDIPGQKTDCYRFMESKTDWKVTKELFEKGVSAYKTSADDRSELRAIRQGAIKKEFDVLLVQHFDRLGRKEEIALMVNFLIGEGIELWSVMQGQRTIENHTDKLINYIDFWRSEGESEKTSFKVRNSKRNLSLAGYFQGGPAPIGYRNVQINPHWKKKGVLQTEHEIDKKERELVELVFSLYIDRLMGYRKIVDYLYKEGYRGRNGSVLGVSTIQRMLANPVYIGRKNYHNYTGEEETQPYNEKLRIISDDRFKEAERIRAKRSNKLKKQDKEGIPLAGKLMFSGIAYCLYCGSKLAGNYLYRTYKYKGKTEGNKTAIYRYRCPLNKGKFHGNHEQNIWGAKKYDKIMINIVKEIISQLNLHQFVESSISYKKTLLKQKEQNVKTIEKELTNYKKALTTLQLEIVKSLTEEKPKFTPDMLRAAIELQEETIKQTEETLNKLKSETEYDRGNYSDVNYISNELYQWEEKFDKADDHLKKAMLSRILNKVYLGKDKVEFELNLLLQELSQGENASS